MAKSGEPRGVSPPGCRLLTAPCRLVPPEAGQAFSFPPFPAAALFRNTTVVTLTFFDSALVQARLEATQVDISGRVVAAAFFGPH